MKTNRIQRLANAFILALSVAAAAPLLASYAAKQLMSDEVERALAQPRTPGRLCTCSAPPEMHFVKVPVDASCGSPGLAVWGFDRIFPTVMPITHLGDSYEAYGNVDIVVLAGGWMPLRYSVRPELVSGFDLESKAFTCKLI